MGGVYWSKSNTNKMKELGWIDIIAAIVIVIMLVAMVVTLIIQQ